jgi:hypothetical protein
MTNLEIDRRLALAIGYQTEDVEASVAAVFVRRCWRGPDSAWWLFDHSALDVIYPIAERYRMMPQWWPNSMAFGIQQPGVFAWHTDPRTCIALAVIEAAERGVLK